MFETVRLKFCVVACVFLLFSLKRFAVWLGVFHVVANGVMGKRFCLYINRLFLRVLLCFFVATFALWKVATFRLGFCVFGLLFWFSV